MGAAFAAVVAAVVAIYIASWLSPRLADRAAQAADDRQRRRQEEAEEHRFRAAALLVYDELRANLSILEIAQKANEVPGPLAFQTYTDHQLLLALHLKPDDRDDVRAAYVYAWVPRVFASTGAATPEPIPENVEAARKKTERAKVVLGWEAAKLPGAYKDL